MCGCGEDREVELTYLTEAKCLHNEGKMFMNPSQGQATTPALWAGSALFRKSLRQDSVVFLQKEASCGSQCLLSCILEKSQSSVICLPHPVKKEESEFPCYNLSTVDVKIGREKGELQESPKACGKSHTHPIVNYQKKVSEMCLRDIVYFPLTFS